MAVLGTIHADTELALGVFPAGVLNAFAGAVPSGWVECNGQALDGTQQANAALWGVIGTSYGGTGQSNFLVPDLRGRAPVGKNAQSVGTTGGSLAHTHAVGTYAMPQHQHAAGSLAVGSHTHANHPTTPLAQAAHSHAYNYHAVTNIWNLYDEAYTVNDGSGCDQTLFDGTLTVSGSTDNPSGAPVLSNSTGDVIESLGMTGTGPGAAALAASESAYGTVAWGIKL